jgi:hypothetical protein
MKIKKSNNHVRQINTPQGKNFHWEKQLHWNNSKIARKS